MSKEKEVQIEDKPYTLRRISTLKAFALEGQLMGIAGRGLGSLNSLDDHMAALASKIMQDLEKESIRTLIYTIIRESVVFPHAMHKDSNLEDFGNHLDTLDDGLYVLHELFLHSLIYSFAGLIQKLKKKFNSSGNAINDFLKLMTGEDEK